ncbi:MAG: PD-(D/E)XK nuclease family protein [Bacteroidota bacterium]
MQILNEEHTKIQSLLDQVGHIDFQYRKTRNAKSFNIFTILRGEHEEVNLHSRFIFELLNPKGSHGCGSVFLELMLQTLGITDIDVNNVSVHREHYKIDIFIKSANLKHGIVIENKLLAEDTGNQLQNYHKNLTIQNYKNIKIFFLTIEGRPPSVQSIGELVCMNISYKVHISQWLQKCINQTLEMPDIMEVLIQYQSLVNKITGIKMDIEEQTKIYNLLAQDDNMLTANKIVSNWKHFRWHTEWDFWEDLDKIISDNSYVINKKGHKYSDTELNSAIYGFQKRSLWYGIIFPINQYADCDVCIRIDRGGHNNVRFGAALVRNGKREIHLEPQYAEILKRIIAISERHESNEWWLGLMDCYPNINFEKFRGENTLKLSNFEFRKNYINALWKDQIVPYINMVNTVVNEIKAE